MVEKKPVIILGAGGHGKVLLDICRASGRDAAGFLDKNSDLPPVVNGCPIVGSDAMLGEADFVAAHEFVLGVGDTDLRVLLRSRLEDVEASLATLVHPSAVLSEFAVIGEGTTVHAVAAVNADSVVGNHCVINTSASIDHDCVLADGVQIGPGASLAGGVRCEENVLVGTGAAVLPNVNVGINAVVGGGSSVAKNVPDNVTVFGVPARIVRPAK